MTTSSVSRVRWAAIGAAIAVSLGAGSVGIVNATKGSGQRPVATSINPCRLADTRPNFNVGPRATPLGIDDTHTIKVTGSNGQCTGIPGDVTAVELNVTAIGATRPTFLTIWPDGPRPNASSLNPAPGQPPTPNAVTVRLSGDGAFNVYNLQGNVHLAVDLVAIYQHHHHDDRYFTKGQVNNLIDGVETTPGPQGPAGPKGPRGWSAWDVIPSGVTVTGHFVADSSTTGSTASDALVVDLPGIAPAALNTNEVNFAADGSAVTTDDDPSCTGSFNAPTAPPGKVCIYLIGSANVGNLQGTAGFGLPDRGFGVVYHPGTTDVGKDMYVQSTWAYTAP